MVNMCVYGYLCMHVYYMDVYVGTYKWINMCVYGYLCRYVRVCICYMYCVCNFLLCVYITLLYHVIAACFINILVKVMKTTLLSKSFS